VEPQSWGAKLAAKKSRCFCVFPFLESGMKDLKAKTVRSGFAKLCGQAASFVLRFASLVVMARLLDPKDFGLVAMVTAITGLYGLFTSAGLSIATIQRPVISYEQLSALFWINLLVGVILAFACILTAPVLVKFYDEPRLFWVTVVVGAGFIFNAAAVQHSALMQRQLRFIALTSIEILSQLLGFVVGVGMAVAHFGYWALVAASIVSPAVFVICVWSVSQWVPGPPRRDPEINVMLRFGGTVTLNSVVVYIAYNLEKVLLGRFWGPDILGLYGRAYQLINIPTENLNSAVGGVTFSALSRLQDDPERLRRYFLKGYALVNSLTLPITMFSTLFAYDIILTCLGPKWMEATTIFRLLTPTVMIFGIINPLAWLLLALGLYGRSFRIALVLSPLVIMAYVVGLPFGPNGVAFAYSAAMTLWLVPHVLWCIHGTVISLRHLVLAVSRPFVSAVIAAAVAFAAQKYIGDSVSPLLRLISIGGVMAITYVIMLLFIMGEGKLYIDIVRELLSRGTEEPKGTS
jgi:O-antigen/teichoic acid export membrane protein